MAMALIPVKVNRVCLKSSSKTHSMPLLDGVDGDNPYLSKYTFQYLFASFFCKKSINFGMLSSFSCETGFGSMIGGKSSGGPFLKTTCAGLEGVYNMYSLIEALWILVLMYLPLFRRLSIIFASNVHLLNKLEMLF
jgi:hypothetical protein